MNKIIRNSLAAAVLSAMTFQASADSKIDTPAAAGTAGVFIPRASTDTAINFTGTTPANVVGSFDAADSTLNRPVTCAGLSTVGTAVPFDTVTFTNSTAIAATVNVRLGAQGNPAAACTDPTDTFLVEYTGSFNPASPLTNCVAVNDDTAGATDRCSTLNNVSVPAGQTVVFLLAPFANTGLFGYEVSFVTTLLPVRLQEFDVK